MENSIARKGAMVQSNQVMVSKKPIAGLIDILFVKAVDGFEPTIKLLQSRALPLGYTAITYNIVT